MVGKLNEDLVFGDFDRNIFILPDRASRDTINSEYSSSSPVGRDNRNFED